MCGRCHLELLTGSATQMGEGYRGILSCVTPRADPLDLYVPSTGGEGCTQHAQLLPTKRGKKKKLRELCTGAERHIEHAKPVALNLFNTLTRLAKNAKRSVQLSYSLT